MLAKLFNGPFEVPAVFSKPIWTIHETEAAIWRLRNGKGGDEVGLTAELLKHVPHEFLDALLRLYNDVLYTGEPPASWSKTLFTMLPKKLRAKQVIDFRHTANLRLLYKVFAYLLLGRLEHVLDAQQPEEQHGFRAKRRQVYCWTKHKQLDFQSGLSAWTYPRRLTGYIGRHCGQPSLSKEFLNL